MTVDEAFKKAYPNITESYPLYLTLKSYFAEGFNSGRAVAKAASRRKWIERSEKREPKTFPTGPLDITIGKK